MIFSLCESVIERTVYDEAVRFQEEVNSEIMNFGDKLINNSIRGMALDVAKSSLHKAIKEQENAEQEFENL